MSCRFGSVRFGLVWSGLVCVFVCLCVFRGRRRCRLVVVVVVVVVEWLIIPKENYCCRG